MDLLAHLHGPLGLVRLLALASLPVAACVAADPSGTTSASQAFASMTGGEAECVRMCDALQTTYYGDTVRERCDSVLDVCKRAEALVSSPDLDPLIAVAGGSIACKAAKEAACESGADCRAYGEHMRQEACEDAWPVEMLGQEP